MRGDKLENSRSLIKKVGEENFVATAQVELQRVSVSTEEHACEEVGYDSEQIIDTVIAEKMFRVIVVNEQEKILTELKLLCTPIDLSALIVGALFAEGVINNRNEIIALAINNEEINVKVIGMFLKEREKKTKTNKDDIVAKEGAPFVFSHPYDFIEPNQHVMQQFYAKKITLKINTLQKEQKIFHETGAAHAAMLFRDGEKLKESGAHLCNDNIFYFAEDIGRHNAIDKVIGKCLLDHGSMLSGCGLALSSRVSFELVAKAARAGVELIIAVSAPSALAIKAADYWQITLCGFTRGNKFNVYTHAWRILK